MITHITKIPLFIYLFNVNYIKQYNILIPLVLAVFIGTHLGKKILEFIPETLFKKAFKITLFAIAIKLILNYLSFSFRILLAIDMSRESECLSFKSFITFPMSFKF